MLNDQVSKNAGCEKNQQAAKKGNETSFEALLYKNDDLIDP